MADNVQAIYFNNKGEVIEPPVVAQQVACDNVVEFCATAVVPDGFTFQFNGFQFNPFNFSFCNDVSSLNCLLETHEVNATVDNPCGGTLTCPVFIEAVRAVGCVRFHVGFEELIPIQEGLDFGLPCSLTFDTTVCVNQVIAYTCAQETCKEDCFDVNFAFLFGPVITTDNCGRQIVSVRGGIGLSFTGC